MLLTWLLPQSFLCFLISQETPGSGPKLCGPVGVLLRLLLLFVVASHISITIIVIVIIVVILLLCVSTPPPSSLFLSLSTQPVKADGRPPRAGFCLRFLPVKGEFFLTAVAKCLLMGGIVGSL